MKRYIFALGAVVVFLSGCAGRGEYAHVDLYKSCYQKEYQLTISEIRSSEDNDLNISHKEAHDALNAALRDSNCFAINDGGGYRAGYSADLLYSSKIIKEKIEKNFATAEEKVYLVVDVTVTLQNFNEIKTYRGKSQIELTNTRILGIGSTPKIDKLDRSRALNTAIRIAIKEASKRD